MFSWLKKILVRENRATVSAGDKVEICLNGVVVFVGRIRRIQVDHSIYGSTANIDVRDLLAELIEKEP